MPSYKQLHRFLTSVACVLVVLFSVGLYLVQQGEHESRRSIAPNQIEGRVVMYYAPGCGGCTSMLPLVAELKEAGYPISTLNIRDNPEIAKRMKIGTVPTFVRLEYESEKSRHVGPLAMSFLSDFCRGLESRESLFE